MEHAKALVIRKRVGVQRLAAQGYAETEIAKRLLVSRPLIDRWVSNADVTTDRRGWPKGRLWSQTEAGRVESSVCAERWSRRRRSSWDQGRYSRPMPCVLQGLRPVAAVDRAGPAGSRLGPALPARPSQGQRARPALPGAESAPPGHDHRKARAHLAALPGRLSSAHLPGLARVHAALPLRVAERRRGSRSSSTGSAIPRPMS
jgi:hypothetical protein